MNAPERNIKRRRAAHERVQVITCCSVRLCHLLDLQTRFRRVPQVQADRYCRRRHRPSSCRPRCHTWMVRSPPRLSLDTCCLERRFACVIAWRTTLRVLIATDNNIGIAVPDAEVVDNGVTFSSETNAAYVVGMTQRACGVRGHGCQNGCLDKQHRKRCRSPLSSTGTNRSRYSPGSGSSLS